MKGDVRKKERNVKMMTPCHVELLKETGRRAAWEREIEQALVRIVDVLLRIKPSCMNKKPLTKRGKKKMTEKISRGEDR